MTTVRKLIVALIGAILSAASATIGASPLGPAGDARADPSAAKAQGRGVRPGALLECGDASYYADSLAGDRTASGEPYNPAERTAAHKTLAFGVKLRVVRPDTGAGVTVTVNDRGPFTPGRVIDLSRAAASEIDMVEAGVAEVCLYVTS